MKALSSMIVMSLAALSMGQMVGKKAPSFSLTELSGTKFTNKSLAGKVVLLDFWANWCGPCKKASPTMDSLSKAYKAKGLVVIGVNVWEGKGTGKAMSDAEIKKAVQQYKTTHNYSYAFSYGNSNDALAKSLGYSAIPQFLLINKQGMVVWQGTGIGNLTELPKAIEQALK